jgi:hypothetical protein
MKRFLLSVVASLGLLTGVSVSANLFTNPDFATSASSWTLGPVGCLGPPFFEPAIGNPPGSVTLNGCGENAIDPTVSQTVSGLIPGHTYTIGWQIALHSNNGGSGAGTSFGVLVDNALIDSSESLSFLWVPDSVGFVATLPSHTFSFAAERNNTDVSYRFDNASLVDTAIDDVTPPVGVPEPGTLMLVALGAFAWRVTHRRNAQLQLRGTAV